MCPSPLNWIRSSHNRFCLLPRRRRSIKWFLGSAAAAVALFVSGVNISPTFAQSMSELPAVSALVKLVTFTEYRAEGDGYHADVKVPAITNMPDKKLQDMLNEKYIAEDQKLYKEFMAEIDQLKDKGRPNKGIDSGYEIVTDTDQLLTIRRWVVQTAASAYETIQYDTIDKKIKCCSTCQVSSRMKAMYLLLAKISRSKCVSK